MIKGILIFNNHGKPRLTKFYHYYVSDLSSILTTLAHVSYFFYLNSKPEDEQQQIIRETFHLISKRDENVCNFLEGGTYVYRRVRTEYFWFDVQSDKTKSIYKKAKSQN